MSVNGPDQRARTLKSCLSQFAKAIDVRTIGMNERPPHSSIVRDLKTRYNKASGPQSIPRFYATGSARSGRNRTWLFKGHSSAGEKLEEGLGGKTSRTAKLSFVGKALKDSPTDQDLEDLHQIITKYIKQMDGRPGWLDYDDFCEVRKKACKRLFPCLEAKLFMRLPKDSLGMIKVDALLYYLSRYLEIKMGYLTILASCAGNRTEALPPGVVSIRCLKDLLKKEAEEMPDVRTTNMLLAEVFATTSSRKFAFFLDPHRTGMVAVRRLVSSRHYAHYNDTKARGLLPENERPDLSDTPDYDPTQWFEPKTALKLYGVFVKLDVRRANQLRKEEFAKWNQGSLTKLFVDQLWQVVDMPPSRLKGIEGEKEMDFQTYLDFALAISHRFLEDGLRYIWRILDVEEFGFLGRFHVRRLMDSVVDKLKEQGRHFQEKKTDLVQEIFDMARPKDPNKIEFGDLLRSQQGGLIVSIMIDSKKFWQYEHREQILAGQR
ncbi:hypothetical protein AAMO2058_000044600 [Amorphochlora amoebiformis]